MTKKRQTSESLSPYWQEMVETAQALNSAVTTATVALAKRLWPEVQEPAITPLEVHQAAMQQHTARGGSPTDELTQLDYAKAMDALTTASIVIRHQGVKSRLGLAVDEQLKQLLPLLTPEEQQTRQITFWRAVRITTGNHDRPNERPIRWIPIFQRKASATALATLKVVAGNKAAEQFKRLPRSSETLWHRYKEKDLLTLHEFARMHLCCYSAHPRAVAAFGALKGAEDSAKKVLGPVSGHPKKSTPRKPEKRRTKTA